jgi:hypothetical protein
MDRSAISSVVAAVVFAGFALAPSSSSAARGLRSDFHLRGGAVSAGPQFAYGGLLAGSEWNCPYCYKGYDYGRGCYQYVWTGFRRIWVNVCLWGWR